MRIPLTLHCISPPLHAYPSHSTLPIPPTTCVSLSLYPAYLPHYMRIPLTLHCLSPPLHAYPSHSTLPVSPTTCVSLTLYTAYLPHYMRTPNARSHHTIPIHTKPYQVQREVSQVDKVSKDRTDNPGMKFRALRLHMSSKEQADDLMKTATPATPFAVIPMVKYMIPLQTGKFARTKQQPTRTTKGYLTQRDDASIQRAITIRHEALGKRPITLGKLDETQTAIVMEIEDLGGYDATGGGKKTKMLQLAITWGLQRMTEKTIAEGARQPRRSFVGTFHATNIFPKINIPADGGPTIICGMQVDVVVTARSPIEAGGLDHMILENTFEMPGSDQWKVEDLGNGQAQIVPKVAGEEYAKTRVTGWYGDAIGRAEIKCHGADRCLWMPPVNGGPPPDYIVGDSETLKARRKQAAIRRQSDDLKAATLDADVYKWALEDTRTNFPGKKVCFTGLKLCCSRHPGEEELSLAAMIRGCQMTNENPLPHRYTKYLHKAGDPTWCGFQPCEEIDGRREDVSKTRLAMQMEAHGRPAPAKEETRASAASQHQATFNAWGKKGLMSKEPLRAIREEAGNGSQRDEAQWSVVGRGGRTLPGEAAPTLETAPTLSTKTTSGGYKEAVGYVASKAAAAKRLKGNGQAPPEPEAIGVFEFEEKQQVTWTDKRTGDAMVGWIEKVHHDDPVYYTVARTVESEEGTQTVHLTTDGDELEALADQIMQAEGAASTEPGEKGKSPTPPETHTSPNSSPPSPTSIPTHQYLHPPPTPDPNSSRTRPHTTTTTPQNRTTLAPDHLDSNPAQTPPPPQHNPYPQPTAPTLPPTHAMQSNSLCPHPTPEETIANAGGLADADAEDLGSPNGSQRIAAATAASSSERKRKETTGRHSSPIPIRSRGETPRSATKSKGTPASQKAPKLAVEMPGNTIQVGAEETLTSDTFTRIRAGTGMHTPSEPQYNIVQAHSTRPHQETGQVAKPGPKSKTSPQQERPTQHSNQRGNHPTNHHPPPRSEHQTAPRSMGGRRAHRRGRDRAGLRDRVRDSDKDGVRRGKGSKSIRPEGSKRHPLERPQLQNPEGMHADRGGNTIDPHRRALQDAGGKRLHGTRRRRARDLRLTIGGAGRDRRHGRVRRGNDRRGEPYRLEERNDKARNPGEPHHSPTPCHPHPTPTLTLPHPCPIPTPPPPYSHPITTLTSRPIPTSLPPKPHITANPLPPHQAHPDLLPDPPSSHPKPATAPPRDKCRDDQVNGGRECGHGRNHGIHQRGECPTDKGGGGKPTDDRHPRQTRGRARSRTDADSERAATGRGTPVDNTDPDTPPTTPDPAQLPVANVRAKPVNPEWDHDRFCELSTHKPYATNRNQAGPTTTNPTAVSPTQTGCLWSRTFLSSSAPDGATSPPVHTVGKTIMVGRTIMRLRGGGPTADDPVSTLPLDKTKNKEKPSDQQIVKETDKTPPNVQVLNESADNTQRPENNPRPATAQPEIDKKHRSKMKLSLTYRKQVEREGRQHQEQGNKPTDALARDTETQTNAGTAPATHHTPLPCKSTQKIPQPTTHQIYHPPTLTLPDPPKHPQPQPPTNRHNQTTNAPQPDWQHARRMRLGLTYRKRHTAERKG